MQILVMFVAAVSTTLFLACKVQASHLDSPNLLSDPGFEGAITTDGPPYQGSWEGFTSGTATSEFEGITWRSGTQSLTLSIVNEPNVVAGAFQDVRFPDGLAGTMAWFSGWHRYRLTFIDSNSEIRIEWRDADLDIEIARTQITDRPDGLSFSEFIVTDAIPDGANSARLVYVNQSFSGSYSQIIFIDDVNFSIAGLPEPSTALTTLLSAAAVACCRRVSRHDKGLL